MPETRTCPICGKTKPLTRTTWGTVKRARNSYGHDAWRGICLDCYNATRRAGRPSMAAEAVEKDVRKLPAREKLEVVEEHRLKARVRELESQNKQLVADLSDARRFDDAARAVEDIVIKPIKPREHKSKLREATALACASDWHVEEEVDPDQIEGRNRYNLEIAEQRMRRFFEAVLYAIKVNRQIFKIRDLILWLGGDIITNYIHEEGLENNLLSPVRAVAFAQAHIAAGIRYLLEDSDLARVVVPCNSGNHGRLTKKQRLVTREANSIEWLLYTNLKREFMNEPRVEFKIAKGAQLYLDDVYGRTIRFTHGDLVRYAGGVGGVTIPIYKALAKWQTSKHADLTVMGHFHQHHSLSDLIINGSLIGHSELGIALGARFEPPTQSFTILDPQRFKSVSWPLWVASREDDIKTRDRGAK